MYKSRSIFDRKRSTYTPANTVCFLFSTVSLLLRPKRSHLLACAESCLFYLLVDVVPTASCESVDDIDYSICR